MQRGLRESWKHRPAPGLYAGVLPYGQLEFYSSGKKVIVYLNHKFHLEGGYETDNGFSSWTLAKVLNDAILKHSGTGMTREELEKLAGDDVIHKKRFIR